MTHCASDVRAQLADRGRAPADPPATPAKRKQADILIVIGRSAKLFRTPAPDRDAYADITIDGHRETWRVRSKGFRGWLRHQYFQEMQAGCNSEAMQVAIETLVSFAQFDKDTTEREVGIRVAGYAGAIYIDIGDPQWRMVEVTDISWRMIDSNDAPVRFRRTSSMRPLPIPTAGGSLQGLRELVNVRTDEDFVLLVAYALAALRPDSNYPVLGVAGVQGSGKSSMIRLLQRLIDPRMPTMRSIPREEDHLIVGAKGAHFLGFDNVSRLSDEMSDAICRLSTGGGSGKRQLYTDDDEILFNGTRPIAFNGIEDVATRPDLVERTILLWLTLPNRRRREREIDAEFEKTAGGTFGALLDGLVKGMQGIDDIDDSDLPRMADFAAWAEACCRAYWPAKTFLNAYRLNLRQAVEVVVDASPVATAVRALMAEQTEWTGTATQLLETLTNIVGDKLAKEKDWPKRPNTLSNKLRRVTPDLAKIGITVTSDREAHTGTRFFTITTGDFRMDGPEPDHRGNSPSPSSPSSQPGKNNRLGVALQGKKIVTEANRDRHPKNGDDRSDNENSGIVTRKPLNLNKSGDGDGRDDVFPTQFGKAGGNGIESLRPFGDPRGDDGGARGHAECALVVNGPNGGNGRRSPDDERPRPCRQCGEDDGKTALYPGGLWFHRVCRPFWLRAQSTAAHAAGRREA
jgi:hypothetical protein